jgi:tRNA-2-methylthio-N6-dimethylallyladenosine synthase
MQRRVTRAETVALVGRLRAALPGLVLRTTFITGFPGETEEQFMQTYRVLADLRLDVAHLARYSVREGTVATRRMIDNVTDEEKMRRFRMLEGLQEEIVAEINTKYLGQTVEVLFEEKVKGRWRGRTPTNKLVFVESEDDLRGQLLNVTVTWTGPWSMQAALVGVRSQKQPELISL